MSRQYLVIRLMVVTYSLAQCVLAFGQGSSKDVENETLRQQFKEMSDIREKAVHAARDALQPDYAIHPRPRRDPRLLRVMLPRPNSEIDWLVQKGDYLLSLRPIPWELVELLINNFSANEPSDAVVALMQRVLIQPLETPVPNIHISAISAAISVLALQSTPPALETLFQCMILSDSVDDTIILRNKDGRLRDPALTDRIASLTRSSVLNAMKQSELVPFLERVLKYYKSISEKDKEKTYLELIKQAKRIAAGDPNPREGESIP